MMSESGVRMFWPFLGMMTVVLLQASNMVVNKVAMVDGTNKFIIVLYGDAVSSLVLLPSLLMLRRSDCPPLTFKLIRSFFFLSLIGMERVAWKNSSSRAKILGSIVSMGGAFIVIFYKGPAIFMSTLKSVPLPPRRVLLAQQSNWVIGGFLFAGEALMISSWYIVQALILRNFPVVLINLFFLNLFATLICGLFCMVAVTDPKAWTLEHDMGLFAILYTSLVAGVLRISLAAWSVKVAGPVYVSMFKPIGIIFAVVLGVIFLGDPLCLGSLIGALVIVSGFYAVMWGKYKEEKTNDEGSGVGSLPTITSSSSQKVPLLQSQAPADNNTT